jgi:hypothetical protein
MKNAFSFIVRRSEKVEKKKKGSRKKKGETIKLNLRKKELFYFFKIYETLFLSIKKEKCKNVKIFLSC